MVAEKRQGRCGRTRLGYRARQLQKPLQGQVVVVLFDVRRNRRVLYCGRVWDPIAVCSQQGGTVTCSALPGCGSGTAVFQPPSRVSARCPSSHPYYLPSTHLLFDVGAFGFDDAPAYALLFRVLFELVIALLCAARVCAFAIDVTQTKQRVQPPAPHTTTLTRS